MGTNGERIFFLPHVLSVFIVKMKTISGMNVQAKESRTGGRLAKLSCLSLTFDLFHSF